MGKAAVIGGGASGMMAAVQLAGSGWEVHLFEKNEKLGKKIYITGKGRCNLTNACEPEELFPSVLRNPKFLYSAFYGFTNQDVMSFFEAAGVPLKTERGKRVFPVSDHASDVIKGLIKRLSEYKVRVHLDTEVTDVLTGDGRAVGIVFKGPGGEERFLCDAVIVATGGLSYPTTGSTGDGYRFARQTGHTVTPLSPSLVPLKTAEDYIPRLAGLSLKNIEFTVCRGKKTLYKDFGEMMFTHTGVTGPLVLSASTVLGKYLLPGENHSDLQGFINLKPALDEAQLDARILREFEAAPNRQFKNAISGLFPASLIPVMLELGGIAPDKPVHSVTKAERSFFLSRIRKFPMTLTGMGSFHEAVITRGGVDVKQVNPSTMESRLVKGLYFAGEVLDLDAVTGGFNLQIAWSTGCAAARGAAENQGGNN